MESIDNRLLKRFTILKRLDYYINESVYYRNFSEDMPKKNKSILWQYDKDSGKMSVYEDTERDQ